MIPRPGHSKPRRQLWLVFFKKSMNFKTNDGSDLIKKRFQETLAKFRLLERHVARNQKTLYKNKNLYYLLCRPETFINAYAKISKNPGSLRDGVIEGEGTMRLFGLEQGEAISNKFKKHTYKWKAGRRVWIPKSGRGSKRPIDISTQEDRIVQEALRGILEAIYEPEFREFENANGFMCTNYGFRPGMSAWNAVENIKIKGRRTVYVIEGDIQHAYTNVNHRKLMLILRRRIADEEFLGVVYDLLKAGVMDKGHFQHSLIGTPQGGIVSPLLFNIYMFENDKKIYETLIKPRMDKKSKPQSNPDYNRLMKKISQLKKQQVNSREEKRVRTKGIKALQKRLFTIPSQKISSLPSHALYCRYADDWVLLVTGTKADMAKIQTTMGAMLRQDQFLELNPNKTKITRLDEGFPFLGFRIKMTKNTQIKITRLVRKKRNGSMERILKRVNSRSITIIPDKLRLMDNLESSGFFRINSFKPISKGSWTVLDKYEIVKKYAQLIRGIYHYYSACDNKRILNRVQYILKYSCAKTLARREKTSVRQVFKKYGENMKVTKHIKGTKEELILTIKYPSNSLLVSSKRRQVVEKEFDPFYIQTFWRTKFKMYSECCICGASSGVAMHHLQSVRQLTTQRNKHRKKEKDFEFIKNQLCRIQIPVCKACHRNITYGKYNKDKPIDYYNQFLARL
jgi:group II intron reverse transcriptase/maturase